MIKYLTYKQIDKDKWDKCINSSFNGIIYAYSWYLDIVSNNWEALVENDYESVMPLTHNKKLFINYLYQPFFTQQLGVFSKNLLTQEKISLFLQKIPSKYKFVEINLNLYNKVDSTKYKTIPNLTFQLDLIISYKNLYQNYSTNTKRNIKKAQTAGLLIETNIHPDQIIDIFRKNRGKTIETFNDKEYDLLRNIVFMNIYKGKAHIRGVLTPENNLCAGAIFIESHSKVIFLFSATSDEGRNNGAMSFLIDEFIKENANRNLTLDFEGSNEENLARFYRSFGSKECVYLQLKINKLPFILKHTVSLAKFYKKVIKKFIKNF